MGPLDLLIHFMNFAAPALAVALVLAGCGRLLMHPSPQMPRWWVLAAANFAAGLLALGAGLWYFGHDGKMATYAALAGACATSQWVAARGWRR